MRKNGIYRECETCGRAFYISQSRIKIGRKTCSINCSPSIFKKGNSGVWLGKKRPNLLKTNAFKTMFKKGLKPWNKGIEWLEMRGECNPNWVGNKIKHEDKRLRRNNAYKDWRTIIYERDDYTCQFCYKRGGRLQADHVKPFSLFPELRYDINNGRTLCVNCHRKTITYGKRVSFLSRLSFEGGDAL